jgi:hypothetical protein
MPERFIAATRLTGDRPCIFLTKAFWSCSSSAFVAGWLAGSGDGRRRIRADRRVGRRPDGAFIGDWLMPRLGIHLGADIVALIVNAFIGAVVLLLILRLVGGGWGRRRDGVGAGSRLKSSSSAISAHVLSPLLN